LTLVKGAKTLVIAEKPSVGRDIAQVLNCRQKGDGCLEGNGYIVTWAIGHLVTLKEPEEYDPVHKRWALKTLPIIPAQMELKVIPKTGKQFQIIKRLMSRPEVASIICATDAGREGELIFRYIYRLTGCTKPFQRLWISSMTDAAIRDGFARLKPGIDYDNLFYSAKCRSEADWLVGMNATRAFTVKYRTLLSLGRVQTPTLAMLVARQQEIDNFRFRDYWEVEATFEGDTGTWNGLWLNRETKETRTYCEEEAQAVIGKVSGKTGVVTELKEEEKKELPPLLYDLTQLQRDANKLYGFSAQQTLTAAQSLYEKFKLITYPRTDSRYLSRDLIPVLKPTLARLAVEPYRAQAAYVLGLSKLPITGRLVNDSKVRDHHAIIPTQVTPNLAKLPERERKVYHLVATRFLAVFYPDYRYILTIVTVGVAGEQFVSKGKTVQELGWKQVEQQPGGKSSAGQKTEKKKESVKDNSQAEEDKENGEKDEQSLPVLHQGDPALVTDSEILVKKTKPPAPYTEASLLSAMEHAGRLVKDEELKEQLKEGGLGTPATRAGIIERLIQVGYAGRQKKAIIPTQKGIQLIGIVPPMLKSPELTGKWEQGLSAIARGEMSSDRFMESINGYIGQIVTQVRGEKPAVKFSKNHDDDEGSSGLGESLTQAKGKGKAGAKAKTAAPVGLCPACRQGQVLPNSKGYGCSKWQAGCKFFIGKIAGKSLTVNQVTQLVTKGETGVIRGFKSKNGGRFQAKLAFKDGKIQFVF
jgi:DNA topoisomerase-3